MALIQQQNKERTMAFVKIQQAIQEDDLWTAAWFMFKFLKTSPVLSNRESKLLKVEYEYRIRVFEDKVKLLKNMAQKHAREDIEDWLCHGKPFSEVEEKSLAKHQIEAEKLLLEISTYGRSVAYLCEIINMKPSFEKKDEEENSYELQAMGKSPGAEMIEKVENTVFDDWVLVRHEEAGEGNYQGQQWIII